MSLEIPPLEEFAESVSALSEKVDGVLKGKDTPIKIAALCASLCHSAREDEDAIAHIAVAISSLAMQLLEARK